MPKRQEAYCFLPDMRKVTLEHTAPPDKPKWEEYPFRHRRIATLKKGIFRPDLPSLRLFEMDDSRGRLTEEHCRHSTILTPAEFEKGVCCMTRIRRFRLPDEVFKEPTLKSPPISWKEWISAHKNQWETFRLTNFQVEELKFNDRNEHFNGVSVAFTDPDYPPPAKRRPRCSSLRLRPADTKFNLMQ